MRRILILSMAYFPKPVGGAEVAIKEITDRILPTDIEFHMVTLRYDSNLPEIEWVDNVLVHRIGRTKPGAAGADLQAPGMRLNKYLYQWNAYRMASKLHKKYRYDGVWAVMAHTSGIPAAIFTFFNPKVAYIQTLQEGDPPEYIEKMMLPVWPIFKRAFTAPTVIQAISVFLANWARTLGATCPVEVIPNGVDTKRFSKEFPPEEIDEIRAKLGKRAIDVFLITTSRLVVKNGIDDVVRALVRLPKTVKFAILGTGQEEAALRKLAEERGVASRVLFLGQVEHEEIPKYLKACDIFIRPSRSEGMGNSFIEAMAAGLPVIATQEGGIVDFLYDAKKNPDKPTTGWAVAKDNPDEIVAAVQDITFARPERMHEVLGNARRLVEERYEWNSIARTMYSMVFSHVLLADPTRAR